MSPHPPSDATAAACPLSELTTRPVSWLWSMRLALGKLAVLEGDPGLGKSLLSLDLCARLSTGRPMPDGSPGPGIGNSIVLNAEDGAEDTIRPRLEALGADLARVFILRPDGDAPPLRLPSDTSVLERALAETGAKLVVIDPLVAFLGPYALGGSDQAMRQALLPLARLAETYACCILLILHLNKGGGTHAVYRGSGSIGLLGACRSAWLIGPDPATPGQCVLAQVKNNLAPAQPSLAYAVAIAAGGPPALSWLGPSPWAADQLLAGAAQSTRLPPRDRARDFLRAVLADGPRTSRDIWEVAQEQGLAERTLNRAKRELKVRSVPVRLDGKQLSYWLLEGQDLPADIPPEATPLDLEPWLAPLREQFPPSTPLDNL